MNNRAIIVILAVLLAVIGSAGAQEGQGAVIPPTVNAPGTGSAGTSPNVVIGPPGLEDFQLEPRERLVTQPAPQPQRPATDPARPVPDAQRPAQRQNDIRTAPTAPSQLPDTA